jgi:5-methylcytosine-specific restriction endonuclease McrA
MSDDKIGDLYIEIEGMATTAEVTLSTTAMRLAVDVARLRAHVATPPTDDRRSVWMHTLAVIVGLLDRHIVQMADKADVYANIPAEVEAAHAAVSDELAKANVLVADIFTKWTAEKRDVLAQHDIEKRGLRSTIETLNAQLERLSEHRCSQEHVRERVWASTNGKCFYCDCDLVRTVVDPADKPRGFAIDHIVPKSYGGPDHIHNYVASCNSCNSSKSDKPFLEFIASRKRPSLRLVPQDETQDAGVVA